MMLLAFWALTYVNGIVATIQSTPVYWSEVVCRAKMDGKTYASPDDQGASVYIKKRVYDRLIIEYHKLQPPTPTTKQHANVCAPIQREARIVLDWLKKQQSVWGVKSEQSLKDLLEQLEQNYEVSWR